MQIKNTRKVSTNYHYLSVVSCNSFGMLSKIRLNIAPKIKIMESRLSLKLSIFSVVFIYVIHLS